MSVPLDVAPSADPPAADVARQRPVADRTPSARTIALVLVWSITTLANLGKAVHIDDSTYLLLARNILEDPLHPMSGGLVLSGTWRPFAATNQPPLLFYGFASVMAVFGESIVALHLLLAAFSALAIWSFHRLAQLLCPERALGLSVIFALGPAFLPAQNLMTDVPVVSLWLLCVWLLFSAPESEGLPRTRAYFFAVLAAGTACLIKYPSLVLLPLIACWIVLRRHWREAWTLLVPLGLLVAWSLFNVFDFGSVHLLNRPSKPSGLLRTLYDLETWAVCMGAVGPFSLLFFAAPRWRIFALAAVATALLLIGGIERGSAATFGRALGVIFLFNGLLLMGMAAAALARTRGTPFEHRALLAAWIAGGTGFIVLFAAFMAVRHVLLVLPPVLLALGLGLEGRNDRTWTFVACAATVLLGAAMTISDAHHAGLYRSRAAELRASVTPQLAGGNELWYVGRWGWRWYAEEAGMKAYRPGASELRRGDIVIVPQLQPGVTPLAPRDGSRVERLGLETVPASEWVRLRTMAPLPLGGYYALGRRGLPWHFSGEPLEHFDLLRIVRD